MSRDPPAEVKLQLRQEAGFGCCICGNPVFEYHHIVPWAQEPHFRIEDMMVLCPNHHAQATRNALPITDQRAAKANPRNIQQGKSAGLLVSLQTRLAVKLDRSIYIDTPKLVVANGEPLVWMSMGANGTLNLGVRMYDSNGNLVAEIQDNEWEAGTAFTWDLQFDYRWLRIRSGPGQIELEVNAKVDPVEVRGQLWYQGNPLFFGPSSTNLGGVTIAGGTFENCGSGIEYRF